MTFHGVFNFMSSTFIESHVTVAAGVNQQIIIDCGYNYYDSFAFRFIISSGDVYNFHFVKNEKTVSIRDCGGTNFSIPLNSAIEFGLLYNPR